MHWIVQDHPNPHTYKTASKRYDNRYEDRFSEPRRLKPEDLPHTEDFCFWAEDGPSAGHSVPATERLLLLAASVTGDVAGI